jgi:hypothetical protein
LALEIKIKIRLKMVGRKERFVGQASEFGLLEEGGRFSIS